MSGNNLQSLVESTSLEGWDCLLPEPVILFLFLSGIFLDEDTLLGSLLEVCSTVAPLPDGKLGVLFPFFFDDPLPSAPEGGALFKFLFADPFPVVGVSVDAVFFFEDPLPISGAHAFSTCLFVDPLPISGVTVVVPYSDRGVPGSFISGNS